MANTPSTYHSNPIFPKNYIDDLLKGLDKAHRPTPQSTRPPRPPPPKPLSKDERAEVLLANDSQTFLAQEQRVQVHAVVQAQLADGELTFAKRPVRVHGGDVLVRLRISGYRAAHGHTLLFGLNVKVSGVEARPRVLDGRVELGANFVLRMPMLVVVDGSVERPIAIDVAAQRNEFALDIAIDATNASSNRRASTYELLFILASDERAATVASTLRTIAATVRARTTRMRPIVVATVPTVRPHIKSGSGVHGSDGRDGVGASGGDYSPNSTDWDWPIASRSTLSAAPVPSRLKVLFV